MPASSRAKNLVDLVGRREDACPGHAGLSAVQEAGGEHLRDHCVEIGVVEDDRGALAAELERDPFHRVGGGPHDRPSGRGRTGEGDFAHIGVRGECRAGHRTEAVDDVDDARGQIGLVQASGKVADLQAAEL